MGPLLPDHAGGGPPTDAAGSAAQEHEHVADELAVGEIAEDQAAVVVDAVDALPADLVDAETIGRARAHLLVDARSHDAKALRVLGRRVLDVVPLRSVRSTNAGCSKQRNATRGRPAG